jgi:outer membrane usher protein
VQQRPAADAPQQGDEQIIVQVLANGVRRGEFTLLRKADGDIWIPAADLPKLEIQPREQARREQDGEVWYSSAALGAAKVVLDEATLTLSIDFRADALEGTRIDLSARRPSPVPAEARTSLLLSYRLALERASGTRPDAALDSDLNLRIHGVLLRQEMHLATAAGVRRFRRGATQVIHDDRDNARRYVAGDVLSTAGAYGIGITAAGLLVQKLYDLTPDVVRQPTATLQATTALPADVEVSVDGTPVYRARVPPGPITLNNLLLSGGTRNLSVTVTDIAGHRQVIEQPFLFNDTVLAKGFREYSYFVGRRSQLAEDGTFQYLEPVWQGYHRYGVSDSLTVAAGGEGNADFHNVGGGITLRSDRLGLLAADLLDSTDHGAHTNARGWSARYTYQSRMGALVLARRRFGEHFRSFVDSNVLFPRDETRVGLSTTWGRFSFSADWVRTHTDTDVHDTRFLRLSTFLRPDVNLFGEYETTRINGVPGWAFNLLLRVDLDTRRWVSSSFKTGTDGRALELATGKQLAQGQGSGYRLALQSRLAEPGNPTTATLGADWHLREANLGVFAVAPLQGGGSSFVQGTVAGALVGLDGYWGLTREVNDAFALARLGVPQAGVEVLLNNQSQGRTDAQGRLFIPELNSIGRQEISINERDLDIQYTLPRRTLTIVPAYRSGHVVDFGIHQEHAIAGTAWILEGAERKPVVSRAWTMQGRGGALRMETSSEGDFYVENAAPGSYTGHLSGPTPRGYTCRMTVPELVDAVVELKEGIVCE